MTRAAAGAGRRGRRSILGAVAIVGLGALGTPSVAEAVTAPATASGGSVIGVEVPSAALGHGVGASVYLPPGYPAPGVSYPVLYLLHGLPGSGPVLFSELDVVNEVDNLIDAGVVQPMIIVAPDDSPGADTDTEWMNSAVVAAQRWGTFVSGDLVDYMDANYPTCPERTARAIGGPSMGAFGAINAALDNPEVYGAVTLWSGYFVANTPLVDGPVGSASWWDASPLYSLGAHLAELRENPLRISFYVSTGDKFAPESQAFAQLLQRDHLPYRFSVYPGTHGYVLWSTYLASELTWLSVGLHC